MFYLSIIWKDEIFCLFFEFHFIETVNLSISWASWVPYSSFLVSSGLLTSILIMQRQSLNVQDLDYWVIYVWVLCRLNLSVSVSLPVSSLLESIGLFIWRKDGGPLIDNLSQLYTLLDPKLFLFNSLTSSDSIILRNLSKFSKFRIEEKNWFSQTMRQTHPRYRRPLYLTKKTGTLWRQRSCQWLV